ncbi:uncharacterized protein LOC142994040 [Genypterus blacodes]|uniref:uncharacterized protein LOC142994040 n=1 Tax=Genypterus blacodes TaxID=154954 RepID=UPI003F775BD7
MNRSNNGILKNSVTAKGTVPTFRPQHSARSARQQGKEAKWKSSFKPLGQSSHESDAGSEDTSTNSFERVELYDPYDPESSESEPEMRYGHRPSEHDHRVGRPRQKRSSADKDFHDNYDRGASHSETGRRPHDGHDIRPRERRSLSQSNRLPERQIAQNIEPIDPDYGSVSRPQSRRSSSPDIRRRTAPYRGQRTSGKERGPVPELSREVNTNVPLSPKRLQEESGYVGAGVDDITASTEVTKKKNRSPIIEKNPFTCELCDVEWANKQELEDHLESKSHWDTMEHIQQENNYDDLTVAFLQEVLQFKVRHCCQVLEESKIQELQAADHMTRVEMFHCAACKVYVSTSASSVESHLSSQEHLCNKKEFEVRQRHACLDKAESVMKKLKPQFELYLQGGDPFE